MNSETNHFSQVADAYSDVRPGYPQSIFQIINQYLNAKLGTIQILEIGSGTGKATNSLISTLPTALITCVEPSIELLSLVNPEISLIPNIKINSVKFEDFKDSDGKFDLIIAATAFHWLDSTIKFERCKKLLKSDGILAVFWNNFHVSDASIGHRIRDIYSQHLSNSDTMQGPLERIRTKITSRYEEIAGSDLFCHVLHHEEENGLALSADRYLKLLNTFPDHNKDNFKNIETFRLLLHQTVQSNGNCIELTVIVNLEIAKPA